MAHPGRRAELSQAARVRRVMQEKIAYRGQARIPGGGKVDALLRRRAQLVEHH